jgi:integrase
MSVLQPIWTKLPETASRVRGRIEAVLSWAKVHGLRDGDNPARWHGHLDQLLPARAKVKRVEHFTALPYDKIGNFMAELAGQQDMAARALQFAILTATRSGEVLGARWNEIKGHIWTIPPERMKGGREHRVPLSDRALALLPRKRAELVFSGAHGRLGPNALTRVIKRLGYNVTVHGFRSTFRDWAAETTAYPNHVVEMALAHAIPSGVEASYRRGDLFEKRRDLMAAWADYCSKVS